MEAYILFNSSSQKIGMMTYHLGKFASQLSTNILIPIRDANVVKQSHLKSITKDNMTRDELDAILLHCQSIPNTRLTRQTW